ncbi:alg9-like mannosyltransferase family domain-containing protein [Phthorimaea operculella]|nr:alg9-like mannosyltransferase family domain-containing protein [Phthorimaea operculella]
MPLTARQRSIHNKNGAKRTASFKDKRSRRASEGEFLVTNAPSALRSISYPGGALALGLLLAARLASAYWGHIADCDETYNYWEPLHFLVYGKGLQTWEYSPVYAIRSYMPLWLFAVPAKMLSWFLTPVHVFYCLRGLLAVLTACAELMFYKAVCHEFGVQVGRVWLFLTLPAAGSFASSAAMLPSAWSGALVSAALAAWWRKRYAMAVLFTAATTLLTAGSFASSAAMLPSAWSGALVSAALAAWWRKRYAMAVLFTAATTLLSKCSSYLSSLLAAGSFASSAAMLPSAWSGALVSAALAAWWRKRYAMAVLFTAATTLLSKCGSSSSLLAAGSFASSAAMLPSAWSGALVSAALAAWWRKRYAMAVLFTAATTLLSWPFTALIGLPIAIDMLLMKRQYIEFFKWSIISLIIILLPTIAVDSWHYGRLVIAPWNIVAYNIFTEHGPDLYGVEPWTYYFVNGFLNFNLVWCYPPTISVASWHYGRLVIAPWNIVAYNIFTEHGPDLYGVEPWTYYFVNGFLNFNLVWVLALSCPVFLVACQAIRGSTARATFCAPYWLGLMPLLLWLPVFLVQPHKEER